MKPGLIAAAALVLAATVPAALADGLLPVGDTYYASGNNNNNNNNFGSAATVNVGGSGPYHGLIQFDLATLPPGTTAASVTQAKLVLFVNKVGTAGAVDINAASGPWTESTVSGINAPAIGMTVATAIPVNTADVYIVVNATAIVKGWLSANPVNHGLIISTSVGFNNTSVFFDSKESTNTSHPAMLQVDLATAGPVGPAGPQGLTGPQGPIGLTGAPGPAGSLTLPFSGNTTFLGTAFNVQNFQLGSGTNFSASAFQAAGGTTADHSIGGGSGKLGISATDSQAGKGGVFLGGSSSSAAGGIGINTTGGASSGASQSGGVGLSATGGAGSIGGQGIIGTGGTLGGTNSGGVGVTGIGGGGALAGGEGGIFTGGDSFFGPAAGIVATGGCNTLQNACADAGHFAGNVSVTGSLSKSSGSFKIDHPLDPANKFLYHSFVESPDMMNIYNGIASLEADGSAWVEMPDWFEALNQDFRYQLTSIGAPGPGLYITSEIQGNRFRIAGGTPGARVSWQVTGIRHDAYANAHRIPVEQLKSGAEQNRYLHPELFQQPANRRIGAVPTRQ